MRMVSNVRNLLLAVAANVRSGGTRALVQEVRKRCKSEWVHYGLARDLNLPFQNPAAKIPITVRPLRKDDISRLLSVDEAHRSDRGPYVRMHRVNFIDAGIGTCYVAVTGNDEPCYMQWLIQAGDNARIEKYFGGIFPALRPDEALLEYAFTPERWQGQGIMAAAMAQISEKARDFGGSRVITFVDGVNIAALKGCQKAGFMPYVMRIDRWRLFRRRCVFKQLSAINADASSVGG